MSSATQWEEFFTAADVCGVISGLVPSLDTSGRNAVAGVGAAMVRGYYKPITTSTGTAIPAASGQNRIDRLVLRLNRGSSTAPGWIVPTVITGTPGTSPVPPTITQTSTGLWDLPICRWTSAPTGALSGLVDERYFLGGQTLLFTSTSRASGLIPASPARFGLETDTGRALVSDGSTWNTIDYYTGWADLTVNGTYWNQGGFPLQTVVRNGMCSLSGSINARRDLSGDTLIAALPADRHPTKSVQIPVYMDGGRIAEVIAYASGTREGQIWVVGNADNVNSGTYLRMTASWPV